MAEENKDKNLLSGNSDSDFPSQTLHDNGMDPLPRKVEFGEPNFAKREIPEEVKDVFRRVTMEQTVFQFGTNEKKNDISQGPANQPLSSDTKNYDPDNHSLKIRSIRYMDNLPRKSDMSSKQDSATSGANPNVATSDHATTVVNNILRNSFPGALSHSGEMPSSKSAHSSQEGASPNPAPSKVSEAFQQEVPRQDSSPQEETHREGPRVEPPQKASPHETPAQRFARMMANQPVHSPASQNSAAATAATPASEPSAPAFRSVGSSGFERKAPRSVPSETTHPLSENKPQQERPTERTVGNLKRDSRIQGRLSPSFGVSPKEESPTPSTPNSAELPQARSARVRELARQREEEKEREKEGSHKSPTLKRGIAKFVALAVVGVVLVAGLSIYLYVSANLKPVNATNTTLKTVNIPEGSSSNQVAKILEQNHLVKNATVFEFYAKLGGLGAFKAGYYSLSESMSPDQVAKALNKGGSATPPVIGKITLPEGYTLSQMATAFGVNAMNNSKSPFTASEFMKVVEDPAFISEMTAKYPTLFANLPAANSGVKYQLEGYLFPATYAYTSKTTAKELVEAMIAKENAILQPYYSQLAEKNIDVNTLLSLASLVEKEANSSSDRKNVAEVFLNRLNQGMPMQSNVPLLYAEGKLGTASIQDDAAVNTNLNSPYNDYTNPGLIPGPVDSPSQSSIESILNHADNNYLYFCANPKTGQIYYATTLDEQNANIAQYVTPNQ